MEEPSDGNGNPEENPKPDLKKESRKKKNNSQTETSSEENSDASDDSVQEIPAQPNETLPPETLEARDSRTSSIGTGTSIALRSTTESQTSDYTNESTHDTTTYGYVPLSHSNSSSFASVETQYGPPPMNFLREIHVQIDPSLPEEEIQSARLELQELLTNAMFHIGQWNNEAIYIITYNYM